MEKNKNKKRTLTISGGLGKKTFPPSGAKSEKKTFNVYKKKPQGASFNKPNQSSATTNKREKPSRKNFSRKYAEQQATKRFIHSDAKDSFKAKIKGAEKN